LAGTGPHALDLQAVIQRAVGLDAAGRRIRRRTRIAPAPRPEARIVDGSADAIIADLHAVAPQGQLVLVVGEGTPLVAGECGTDDGQAKGKRKDGSHDTPQLCGGNSGGGASNATTQPPLPPRHRLRNSSVDIQTKELSDG